MKDNVYYMSDYRTENVNSDKKESVFKSKYDSAIKDLLELTEEDKEVLDAMRKILNKEIHFD